MVKSYRTRKENIEQWASFKIQMSWTALITFNFFLQPLQKDAQKLINYVKNVQRNMKQSEKKN